MKERKRNPKYEWIGEPDIETAQRCFERAKSDLRELRQHRNAGTEIHLSPSFWINGARLWRRVALYHLGKAPAMKEGLNEFGKCADWWLP